MKMDPAEGGCAAYVGKQVARIIFSHHRVCHSLPHYVFEHNCAVRVCDIMRPHVSPALLSLSRSTRCAPGRSHIRRNRVCHDKKKIIFFLITGDSDTKNPLKRSFNFVKGFRFISDKSLLIKVLISFKQKIDAVPHVVC